MSTISRLCLQAADYCPQQCLEWLTIQVTKNKFAHAWTLQNLDAWVEPFLLAHNNIRVRNCESVMEYLYVYCTQLRLYVCSTLNTNFCRLFQCTLTFQIGVHIRLFIFRKKSPLYDFIRVYTFIRFEANPPYTIFIWYVRLLS